MTRLSGSTVIQNFLQTYEIPYIFGNPGTTETMILEAISHCKETTYILSLHESSAIGIAAGFALINKTPAVINIHTYPGLANSMCNLYNAFCSGIPLLVIAGQQHRKSLIHDPVLSGPLTQLAETAVKYSYQVMLADDLAIALQRCYTKSMIAPSAPTFLSIPMDVLEELTDQAYFKKPCIYQSSIDKKGITELCDLLSKTKKGKLAFIVDYEATILKDHDFIGAVANYFEASLYASPYHVHPVLHPLSTHYTRTLPVISEEIHDLLSQYETIVIFGAKLDTFLYTRKQALPSHIKLAQISSPEHLCFDYPCDLAISSDVNATLSAIVEALNIPLPKYQPPNKTVVRDELTKESDSNQFSDAIFKILDWADLSMPLITEGSSEDALIQKAAAKFGFSKVYFSPRGGGLGWAMPLATGISLATKKHSICFVGDGGSLYSIHSIWTAARYKIPVIYICFVNHEYKILKDLWCKFQHITEDQAEFIGLDINDPEIDILSLAKSFGASVCAVNNGDKIGVVLDTALRFQGPTFIGVFAKKPEK